MATPHLFRSEFTPRGNAQGVKALDSSRVSTILELSYSVPNGEYGFSCCAWDASGLFVPVSTHAFNVLRLEGHRHEW